MNARTRPLALDSLPGRSPRSGILISILLLGAAYSFSSMLRQTGVAEADTPKAAFIGTGPLEIVLMNTAYCVVGVNGAAASGDPEAAANAYAHGELVTLYPGNIVRSTGRRNEQGAVLIELPQSIGGQNTCWMPESSLRQ